MDPYYTPPVDSSTIASLPQPDYLNVEYIFYNIYVFFHGIGSWFSSSGGSSTGASDMSSMGASRAEWFGSGFKLFLYLLLLFFITVLAYTTVRMFEIRKKEHEHLHHEIHEYAHKQKEKENSVAKGIESVSQNQRWVSVLKNVSSDNDGDWKIAVIDADEMLNDLMTDLGFKGDSLGEKLKVADRDKFHSLSAAWEVHTIRNRIAHEGSAFTLTSREAKRVIALYEQIFREFGYI